MQLKNKQPSSVRHNLSALESVNTELSDSSPGAEMNGIPILSIVYYREGCTDPQTFFVKFVMFLVR